MIFELFATPKRVGVSNEEIPKLLSELNLKKHEDVVWEISSDEPFSKLLHFIEGKIGSDYDFGFLALDGSEYNPVPDQVDSNKPYLKFCIQRTRDEPSEGLSPIRVHFETHLEHRLRLLMKRNQ